MTNWNKPKTMSVDSLSQPTQVGPEQIHPPMKNPEVASTDQKNVAPRAFSQRTMRVGKK